MMMCFFAHSCNFRSYKKNLKFNFLLSLKSRFRQQIAEEGFLEFINNILTIGYVPALFSDEEKDVIINNIRDDAKKAGYAISK